MMLTDSVSARAATPRVTGLPLRSPPRPAGPADTGHCTGHEARARWPGHESPTPNAEQGHPPILPGHHGDDQRRRAAERVFTSAGVRIWRLTPKPTLAAVRAFATRLPCGGAGGRAGQPAYVARGVQRADGRAGATSRTRPAGAAEPGGAAAVRRHPGAAGPRDRHRRRAHRAGWRLGQRRRRRWARRTAPARRRTAPVARPDQLTSEMTGRRHRARASPAPSARPSTDRGPPHAGRGAIPPGRLTETARVSKAAVGRLPPC